jgi:hypothetical protein
MVSPPTFKPDDIELVPDSWARFERAVDTVVKGGPQHRVVKSGQSATDAVVPPPPSAPSELEAGRLDVWLCDGELQKLLGFRRVQLASTEYFLREVPDLSLSGQHRLPQLPRRPLPLGRVAIKSLAEDELLIEQA